MPQLSDASPTPKAAGPFNVSLVQRAALTVGALLAYHFAAYIPLPGLDASAVADFYSNAGASVPFPNISGFMLGTVPMLSALIFAEVLMLIFPTLRRWQAGTGTRTTFERSVLAGALAIAGFQAWGIASALEGLTGVVEAPGLGFHISTMVATMAATALIAWLARFISKYGVGNGFWLLFLTPVLFNAASSGTVMLDAARTGNIAPAVVFLPIGFAVLVTAALVGLERMSPGLAESETFIWPVVLASAVPALLLTVFLPFVLFDPGQMDAIINMAAPGEPLRLISLAVLVPLLVFFRQDSIAAAGLPLTPLKSPAIVAAVLTAVMLAGDFLAARSGLPSMPNGQTLIILVSVALGILAAIRSEPASTP